MEGVGKNLLGTFSEQPAKPVENEKKEPIQQEEGSEKIVPKAEEKEVVPAQPEPTAEPVKEVKTEDAPNDPPSKPEEPVKAEINDEVVTNWLKEKYADKEINTLDDLFKKPEPTPDPLEGVSEDALQFLKYNKETGRGLEDWNKLNEDYSKKSPLELAREKVAEFTKGDLKGKEIDEYLEKKLGIDLSDPKELDKYDLVELKTFSRDYLEQKESEREKYKKPIEKAPEKEMVQLQDGRKIPKEDYDKLVDARNNYLNSVKAAADKITKAEFKVSYDDNGDKKEIELEYGYSKDDVHKMTSLASDLDATLSNLFGTKEGIDHVKLNESLFWLDPEGRQKAISAIVHKALAKRTEELMEELHNPSFKPKGRIPKEGGKVQPINGGTKKPGTVQYDFTNV